MGSVINVKQTGYSEYESIENWAGEYAKRTIETHKTAEILDHPDGSVTEVKLSGDLQEKISTALGAAEIATEGMDAHTNNNYIHTTADEKAAVDARITSVENTAKNTQTDLETVKSEVEGKAEKEHVHIEYAKITDVPKKVGELENDSGYLTEHQDISGKADTKYVDASFSAIHDELHKYLSDIDISKADKATKLAGYGITDAYTKYEIDTQIDNIDTALDNILAIQETLIGGDGK